MKFQRNKEQNTLVVRHFCERENMLHGVEKTKSQFAYLHLKTTCVCKKLPEFTKAQVMVAEEVGVK